MSCLKDISIVSMWNKLCTTPLNNRGNKPYDNVKCAYSSTRNNRPKEPHFPCAQSYTHISKVEKEM